MTPQNIDMALSGDKELLNQMIDMLAPVVHERVARTLIRRKSIALGRNVRQEVEDFIQEVFIALFEQDAKILRAWSPERGLSFLNFVGLVAERHVTTILRTGKRSPWREDPTQDTDIEWKAQNVAGAQTQSYYTAETQVASKELLQLLLGRLAMEVSPLGQRLFELMFVQQRSPKFVCKQMNMSADAVYTWRRRLRNTANGIIEKI